jgi:hypothetical protein
MFKTLALFVTGILACCTSSFAQGNGILPFTGIQYFNEGIYAKYAEISIDGSTLMSNRIPANKEFIFKLQLPAGFTEDAAKKVYPAVEVIFFSSKKQQLAVIPNLLKDSEKTGFSSNSLKEVPVKLILQSQWLKSETECVIQVRYYDLKSKKQLRLLFPVSIAAANEPLALSKVSTYIKTSDQSLGLSSAVRIDKATLMVDTSIRVAPKNAYLSIEIPEISGTSMNEVLNGKNTFWVYDKNMNEIKITDKLLKKIGGAMEDNLVNLTVKIPFRLKTDTKQMYTVRYRWESTDRKKIIDIVSTK